MKKTAKIAAFLLALAMVFSMAACGADSSGTESVNNGSSKAATPSEASDALKGVFDTFVKNQSYNDVKSSYDTANFEETVDENGITVKVRGTGGVQGTYSFPAKDGYLCCELSANQSLTPMLFNLLVNSVGEYYGIDATLFSGYINGLGENGMESKDYAVVRNNDGTGSMKIYYQEKPEMKELDKLYINENSLKDLSKDTTNAIKSVGKIYLNILIDANDDTIRFAIGEYGDKNTELTYQSIMEIVNHFKPAGYETFVKDYKELKTAAADNYTVTDDVKKYGEGDFEPIKGYSFLYVTFHAKDAEK